MSKFHPRSYRNWTQDETDEFVASHAGVFAREPHAGVAHLENVLRYALVPEEKIAKIRSQMQEAAMECLKDALFVPVATVTKGL